MHFLVHLHFSWQRDSRSDAAKAVGSGQIVTSFRFMNYRLTIPYHQRCMFIEACHAHSSLHKIVCKECRFGPSRTRLVLLARQMLKDAVIQIGMQSDGPSFSFFDLIPSTASSFHLQRRTTTSPLSIFFRQNVLSHLKSQYVTNYSLFSSQGRQDCCS